MTRRIMNLSARAAARFGVSHLAGAPVEVRSTGLVWTLDGRWLGLVEAARDVAEPGRAPRRRRLPLRMCSRCEGRGFPVGSLSACSACLGFASSEAQALTAARGLPGHDLGDGVASSFQVVTASSLRGEVVSSPGWVGVALRCPLPSSLVLEDLQVLVRRRRGWTEVAVHEVSQSRRAWSSQWLGVVGRWMWSGRSAGAAGRCGCDRVCMGVGEGRSFVLLATDRVRGFRPVIEVRLRVHKFVTGGLYGCA